MEMNLHLPQSVEAAIELREIAAVPRQMISPRLSKPLISIVQDTLVGVNRLTRPAELFVLRDLMNLLVHSKRWDGQLARPATTDRGVQKWSGQQVVSALLPSIFLRMGNKVWDKEKGQNDPNFVTITNGTVKGILDGDIFDKGLIHTLYNDFSPDMTVDFIDSLQSVVATYLQNSGFSVGLSDLIADEGTLATIAGDLAKLKAEIESIQLQVHMGLFDNASGRSNQDEFESRVFQTLDKVITAAGKTALKSLSSSNRMVNMVKCGSKGSDLNIAQMIALLGQQSIEGKRIAYGFQDRTLPHFKRYDDGAEARGFIESSFVNGLSPAEFFFHAMTGREGLIDTAVKSVTGDTQITIRDNSGQWQTIAIGEWIDSLMALHTTRVQHSQPANLELLDVSEMSVGIWTADSQGIPSIAAITAVTRHDPGTHLFKITTETASVTVSASKSLCVFDDCGFLVECEPANVVVGDCVCVLKHSNDAGDDIEEITAIERIDVTDSTMRLYDLTVPSTLNFALANGLVVRDTADSGYMQRQLVKALEDLRIEHDGSVRDVGGLLVQPAYGDDGTSATKIETQPIGLGEMTDTAIRQRFAIPDVAPEKSQEFVAAVLNDRDMLVQNVWGGRVEKSVQSAVHLPRLIENAKVQLGLQSGTNGTGTGPGNRVPGAYVLEAIDRILDKTRRDNQLWAALLRFYLNPRDLQEAGFTQPAFDWLTEQIIIKHMKSWVVPGEMAGIIAAQSLGEPTTQMCSVFSTVITVRKLSGDGGSVNAATPESDMFVGPVGEFIDKILAQNTSSVKQTIHGPDSVFLDLSESNKWAIMGVGNDETASWKPISQVSRHPANGGLVRVTTKSGRVTTATLTHSFLKRTTNGIVEVKGSDLCIGHRIPVATRQPESPNPLTNYKGFALTRDFGWLVGIYLADGSFNGNRVSISKIHPVVEDRIRSLATVYKWTISTKKYMSAYGPSKTTEIHSKELKGVLMELCNTGSYNKQLSAPIFHSNKAFIAGVLSGYFDGDGNINATRQQIRVGSRSKRLVQDIARLLPVCGVFGTLCEERSVHMPDQVMYTLSILRKHAELFQREIGLHITEKAAALAEIVEYNNRASQHSLREDIDLIPELGNVIAETGRLLAMPGQSRLYGRYAKKSAIGRRTLQKYIAEFEAAAAATEAAATEAVAKNIAILTSAANSDVIWDEITQLEILPDPHELVYDFTVPGNDSFMVDDSIFVHNTLNSVDWDTEIVIAKDGKIITPRIGEFIDNYIETHPDKIQNLPNDQVYVSLEGDGHEWSAASCDENGVMQWTRLEAVTRHPVVNDDGTDTILEVTTESGRTVKATKGRSFLTVQDNKLVHTNGSDLRPGTELPIANTLALEALPVIDTLRLADILPKTEWLYGSEVQKALAAMHTADTTGNRHWFSAAMSRGEFTVPYARSDSFRDAFTRGKNMHAENIHTGFVYPKKLWCTISQIPDTIPLNRAFGFFCGAYVAEGSTSPTQVNITNNDDAFLAPLRTLLDTWNVGHHTVSEDRHCLKTDIKGHTTSLIVHSTLLTELMKHEFGATSYTKTLPSWVLQAPDDFVKGFVDGYISGDGCVTTQNSITASSVSKPLIMRVMALMTRFGIFSTTSYQTPKIRSFKSVSTQHNLYIPQKFAYVFANTFTLTIGYKQERLNAIKTTSTHSTSRIANFGDMILDRVKSITDTLPKGGKMYDVTVKNTRNFLTLSAFGCADTFHLSGVAAKSGMTRGVPRLKELLKVTQNPRATSLTIYLRRDLRTSKEAARKLAQELEFTTLRDLVTVSRIYYDPRDSATLISSDSDWLKFFALFEQSEHAESGEGGGGDGDGDGDGDGGNTNPWIIRFELDREKMFNKNITMDQIAFVLRNAPTKTPIKIAYTDHNATQMVFRVRMDTNSTDGVRLDDLTILKQIQNKLLSQTLVRGLPGLRTVTFRPIKNEVFEKNPAADNKFEPADQFVLDTLGTNFIDVMIHPDVDGLKLISNHVHDINDNLGIEAARQLLFREIFTLFEQAAPVNYRHVALLCDEMCNRGRLMSTDRYGVNKKRIGPLAKASFEQTEDIMLRAALFGELDPVTGVSANIMTGQSIRGGTAFSQVLLDEGALAKLVQNAPPQQPLPQRMVLTQNQIQTILEGEGGEGGDGDGDGDTVPGCTVEDLRIPVALPPMEAVGVGAGVGVGIGVNLPNMAIRIVK